MFKNALKNLSSGISNISSSISNKFTDVFSKTKNNVNNIISTETPAANDNIFNEKTSEAVNNVNKSTNNIINFDEEINYKVLWDFSGIKILTLKGQKIKLVFEEGKIKKALKDVKWKYIHLNAKAIRQLTQILQKKSTDVNRVSYNTKRNTKTTSTVSETNHSSIKSPKLNGSKKHNDAILAKQKREKIQAEKIKQEQYRMEKESHMQQDYKILFRYQSTLSKCNTQWDMVNGSQNIAEVVLKTLAARKGITLNNFQKFSNNQKNFQVLKKVLSDYLTIDSSYSAIWKSNRDALFNIFMNASEIYSTYLYKKNKSSSNKKKPGPNIFDHQSNNHTTSDKNNKSSADEKAAWVKKHYPNEEAA